MVNKIHYRWDFIGLSTDTKPTPADSPKVVNGSTFYCSDTSKLYVFYKDTWYERKPLGGGGGGGGSYTAGDGIIIANDEISVDTTTIQPKLTAGSNVTIENDTISATDTTYSTFTGTDGTAAGTAGLVPAPATTDAGKFLKADGTWDTAGGGSGPTVVQTPGSSTTDVMSQKAVTSMIFADPSDKTRVQIGAGASTDNNYEMAIGPNATCANFAARTIALGNYAATYAPSGIAIGYNALCNGSADYSVALGAESKATQKGQVDISTLRSTNTDGYNNSQYRLLTGLYDGQSAHDAATVGQINATIDAINTALSTSIPHIGA